MRVAIVTATVVLLFACERGVESPQPYGVGKYYGGPGHAYSSSTGGSVFLVVPLDASDSTGLLDISTPDGATADVPFDFGFEATAAANTCLDDYEGWEDFCICEYDPDPPIEQDKEYCVCKHLVCMEDKEQHPSVVGGGAEIDCAIILEEAGEFPGSCG